MLINKIGRVFFGSRNQRTLQRLGKLVKKINARESYYQGLSNEELRAKTDDFKNQYASGTSLTELLVDAFAVVREASSRVLGMRHFDVQLIGGMVLHEGNIAEMRTGEGKTVMATLPAYLNALTGKGVHVVTVNDYLATRDAEWMRPLYEFLGLSVAVVIPNLPAETKRAAYACDIVYATNNELGFDYLRDNMAFSLENRVQRELQFAIVDEVDSILIDEARTPLIISGPAQDQSSLYLTVNRIIPALKPQTEKEGPGDYSLDEKNKQAYLTEAGHQQVEDLLTKAGLLQVGESLYDVAHISLMHHVYSALRAHTLYHRDVDYIVENNEVMIIDEHTGRKMVGRRWSQGLHQAVEAKEGVKIQNENQTLASITFQNYFRLYAKLSGMTGTADTEAYEFRQIYGLDVVVIPTNRPMVRQDQADVVYMARADKFTAIIRDIQESIAKGQPVLVGTASIETSEYLSGLLNKEKIPHQVLNAKFHEKEAHIIAQAGRPGAVTIATNMAGRGTDIVLGGSLAEELKNLVDATPEVIAERKAEWQKQHDAVVASGGLRIIGSERHESRRIDNQLRGRSGRQGDPGSSRFYLSLEDNLLRIFAADRLKGLMRRIGMKDHDVIESNILTRVIENAQRKVEGFHFDIRKQLLEFDDVANDQRRVVYQQRTELLGLPTVTETLSTIRTSVMQRVVRSHIPENSLPEQWDLSALDAQLKDEFGIELQFAKQAQDNEMLSDENIIEQVLRETDRIYNEKALQVGEENFKQIEKSVMLQVLDSHWRDHINALDHLRQGIHLRGYAQKNPKQEYKREAFALFSQLLDSIKEEVLNVLMKFELRETPKAPTTNSPANIAYSSQDKIARNALCPCGSGEKYKACHGQVT